MENANDKLKTWLHGLSMENVRLIDVNSVLSETMFHTWKKKDLVKALKDAPTIDPVHAAGGCYCHECEISGCCLTEETFHFVRKDNPFCCVGKVKGKENG